MTPTGSLCHMLTGSCIFANILASACNKKKWNLPYAFGFSFYWTICWSIHILVFFSEFSFAHYQKMSAHSQPCKSCKAYPKKQIGCNPMCKSSSAERTNCWLALIQYVYWNWQRRSIQHSQIVENAPTPFLPTAKRFLKCANL